MRIKLSKSDWKRIGTKLGWMKRAQESDIEQVASKLHFMPTSKKPLEYKHWEGDAEAMPPMSYKLMTETGTSVTKLDNTQRDYKSGDIMVCGPQGEKYTMSSSKFAKNYDGKIGESVVVEQTPRMVARYEESESIRFTASWGEGMDLNTGDYLVREAPGKYYRIEKTVFEETYNEIGL